MSLRQLLIIVLMVAVHWPIQTNASSAMVTKLSRHLIDKSQRNIRLVDSVGYASWYGNIAKKAALKKRGWATIPKPSDCFSYRNPFTDTGLSSPENMVHGSPTGRRRLFRKGSITASGRSFDPSNPAQAAHRWLPFGTLVRVKNLENDSSTIVEVVDRGPYLDNRIIDLTRAGAEKLGFRKRGLTRVKLEVVKLGGAPNKELLAEQFE